MTTPIHISQLNSSQLAQIAELVRQREEIDAAINRIIQGISSNQPNDAQPAAVHSNAMVLATTSIPTELSERVSSKEKPTTSSKMGRAKRGAFHDAIVSLLKQAVEPGMSVAQLAHTLGRTTSQVRTWLVRHGEREGVQRVMKGRSLTIYIHSQKE